MNLEQRSALRKKRIKSYRAKDFADAERWDLQFWQERSPEERLSALVAIREDVEKVEAARRDTRSPEETPDGNDPGL